MMDCVFLFCPSIALFWTLVFTIGLPILLKIFNPDLNRFNKDGTCISNNTGLQHASEDKCIGPHDMIFGRGKYPHPGIKTFRDLVIRSTQNLNKSITKRAREEVAQQIVDDWHALDPPGRFLEKHGGSDTWRDVGDEVAFRKTCQRVAQCFNKRGGATTHIQPKSSSPEQTMQVECQSQPLYENDVRNNTATLKQDEALAKRLQKDEEQTCIRPKRTLRKKTVRKKTDQVSIGKLDPLEKIGQHIVAYLRKSGWTQGQPKVNGIHYDVFYRPGVDKNNAEEGKDKITGYPKMAEYAFSHGVYEEYLKTVEGKEMVSSMEFFENPSDVFESCNDFTDGTKLKRQRVEHSNVAKNGLPIGGPGKLQSEKSMATREKEPTKQCSKATGIPMNEIHIGKINDSSCTKHRSDSCTSSYTASPLADYTKSQSQSASLHKSNFALKSRPSPVLPFLCARDDILDNEAGNATSDRHTFVLSANNDNMITRAPIQLTGAMSMSQISQQSPSDPCVSSYELMELFDDIQAKFIIAKKSNDTHGKDFYGHIVQWCKCKKNNVYFSLGQQKHIIQGLIDIFVSRKEKMEDAVKNIEEAVSIHENFILQIISDCKKKLRLS